MRIMTAGARPVMSVVSQAADGRAGMCVMALAVKPSGETLCASWWAGNDQRCRCYSPDSDARAGMCVILGSRCIGVGVANHL